MELKTIFESLLKEQPGMNTMELPKDNVTISFFPAEKKILVTMQDHTAMTSRMRTYVNLIKQNFNVYDTKYLNKGTFELRLDPREDFQALMNFMAELPGAQ